MAGVGSVPMQYNRFQAPISISTNRFLCIFEPSAILARISVSVMISVVWSYAKIVAAVTAIPIIPSTIINAVDQRVA